MSTMSNKNFFTEKLLSELQKILRGSEPLRRLGITKGSFETSRQFLHLCVSSEATILQKSLCPLEKKKQIKQKVEVKKKNPKHTH